MQKDLIVIGGGPGGYVAAIRAAQLGRTVTLIEKEAIGGTCLNCGCIPTKAYVRSAEVLDEIRRAGEFGLKAGDVSVDLDAVRERTAKAVERLVGGVDKLLGANKVEIIRGEASFTGPKTLMVNGEEMEFVQAIIATGSKPAVPPIPGIDLPGVMDSTEALKMETIPGKLLVIGGGVIGIEMAGIYQAFGSEVTVIEFMPSILPMVDEEIAAGCAMLLKMRGIDIHTSAKVLKIEQAEEGLSVTVEENGSETVYSCDRVLACVGRGPMTDGLGLDKAGVTCEKRGIPVDENYETSVKGIFAIGDVTGRIMLAHVATEEGKVCVERMAGRPVKANYDLVPNCVFTFPEIASAGKTEKELKDAGRAYKVGRFNIAENGKAITMGETNGLVKVIADPKSDVVLGVHIAGPHASDLIHTAVMAIHAELTVSEMTSAIYAHPTLAEAIDEAALGVHGEAIHAMPKKKR